MRDKWRNATNDSFRFADRSDRIEQASNTTHGARAQNTLLLKRAPSPLPNTAVLGKRFCSSARPWVV
jgi:hypothetical protein